MAAPAEHNFDIAVIGGSLSGSSTALQLRRRLPGARILVIEKSEAFGRRVGEATIELSGYFLTRILGLTAHLNEHHHIKQGLRFWFQNPSCQSLDDCAEIGGRYWSRVPSYLVDRAVLDEELLRRATASGVELWRPGNVLDVQLTPGCTQRLRVNTPSGERTVQCRWIVDASGAAALLARQNGWWRANTEHPTASLWSRWRGVAEWDGLELADAHPGWAQACWGSRGTATNHLLGPGWWAWMIQLKGGDVSIGVVWDQRLADIPDGPNLTARLRAKLTSHPVGRRLLTKAECIEGDIHWRKNLAYSCSTLAGDGFVLVGDAAGFLDPFYSPGMDWIALTTWSAAKMIGDCNAGTPPQESVEAFNRDFTRSYARWFDAIYRDKYEYMAEFDLMRVAFRMDIANYYLGVAGSAYRRGAEALREPLFSTKPSVPFYWLMRTYNRRLAAIARRRRLRGELGRANDHRRLLVPGYNFGPATLWPVAQGLIEWLKVELKEGWRTWFAVGSVGTEAASKAVAPHRTEPQPASTA
jgi:flavin-dependent dehydrogenase